jgi:hypothetical protein
MTCVLKIVVYTCRIKTCNLPSIGCNNGVSDGLRRSTHRPQIRRSSENTAVLVASERRRLKYKCVKCVWLRFAELRKATVSFVMSVRPSVCVCPLVCLPCGKIRL